MGEGVGQRPAGLCSRGVWGVGERSRLRRSLFEGSAVTPTDGGGGEGVLEQSVTERLGFGRLMGIRNGALWSEIGVPWGWEFGMSVGASDDSASGD